MATPPRPADITSSREATEIRRATIVLTLCSQHDCLRHPAAGHLTMVVRQWHGSKLAETAAWHPRPPTPVSELPSAVSHQTVARAPGHLVRLTAPGSRPELQRAAPRASAVRRAMSGLAKGAPRRQRPAPQVCACPRADLPTLVVCMSKESGLAGFVDLGEQVALGTPAADLSPPRPRSAGRTSTPTPLSMAAPEEPDRPHHRLQRPSPQPLPAARPRARADPPRSTGLLADVETEAKP